MKQLTEKQKKPTLSKREKSVFLNKDFVVFLTFPMKFANNRRVSNLPKQFPNLAINCVFSKNATKNCFYHCMFSQEVLDANGTKDIMKENALYLTQLINEAAHILDGTKSGMPLY
jgi:hypothetical protein